MTTPAHPPRWLFQEFSRTVAAYANKRESSSSAHSGESTREGSRSSLRMLERVMPWRNKNRVANYGEFDEQLARGSILESAAEEQANMRASSLTLGNQVGLTQRWRSDSDGWPRRQC